MSNYGFSLGEIKQAGIAVPLLKFNKVRIDRRRQTCKDEYVELLKKMELKTPPKKEKSAALKKEKKAKAAKADNADAAPKKKASKKAAKSE